MTLAIFQIPEDARIEAEPDCETCHGEYVDVNGGRCPDCHDDITTLIDKRLEVFKGQEIEQTAMRLGLRVKEIDAETLILKQHVEYIAKRIATRERTLAYLKEWIKWEMETAGVDKVKGDFATIYLQNNPAAIEVIDEEAVPKAWKRATLQMPLADVPADLVENITHVDVPKTPIKENLEETGEIPPGIQYRAKGDTRHLRIR